MKKKITFAVVFLGLVVLAASFILFKEPLLDQVKKMKSKPAMWSALRLIDMAG